MFDHRLTQWPRSVWGQHLADPVTVVALQKRFLYRSSSKYGLKILIFLHRKSGSFPNLRRTYLMYWVGAWKRWLRTWGWAIHFPTRCTLLFWCYTLLRSSFGENLSRWIAGPLSASNAGRRSKPTWKNLLNQVELIPRVGRRPVVGRL